MCQNVLQQPNRIAAIENAHFQNVPTLFWVELDVFLEVLSELHGKSSKLKTYSRATLAIDPQPALQIRSKLSHQLMSLNGFLFHVLLRNETSHEPLTVIVSETIGFAGLCVHVIHQEETFFVLLGGFVCDLHLILVFFGYYDLSHDYFLHRNLVATVQKFHDFSTRKKTRSWSECFRVFKFNNSGDTALHENGSPMIGLLLGEGAVVGWNVGVATPDDDEAFYAAFFCCRLFLSRAISFEFADSLWMQYHTFPSGL